jgi:dienelactone hydrolase
MSKAKPRWFIILLVLLGLISVATFWLYAWGPYRLVSLDRRALAAAAPKALLGRSDEIPNALEWIQRRTRVLQALETDIYGRFPDQTRAIVVRRQPISAERAGGIAGVEQLDVEAPNGVRFNLVLVVPSTDGPAPVIIMQNFCGNQAAFPGRPSSIAPPTNYYPIPCRYGAFDPLHRAVFGEWMLGPPYERIVARGYAVATFYGGDVVPDHAPDAGSALQRLGADGALAAWAWTHARVIDVLETDPRIDQQRIIAWGQSRFGKVALLAAASDLRIDAVVAFQSGRGGDALTSHRAGESVAAISRTYPHWFSPRYSRYTASDPAVDQHDLLTLIAPRPLFIGHAARDSWADPAGAYQAMAGARQVFDALNAPPPVFSMRAGAHGIVDRDWTASLDFLDRSLPRP